ncbi:MAG: glycosyltransferase 61 family protein [Marinibacterium sp.]
MQFSDIRVAPYDARYLHVHHCGGPVWPDWDSQTAARHNRDGVPVDECPPEPATWTEIPAAQWVGPVFPHFGHMVAEFGMRILPSALNGNPAPLLFLGWPADRYAGAGDAYQATPPVFRAILDYAGLTPDRVRVTIDPLRVGALSVEPQAEQLDTIGPTPAHLDLLDAQAEKVLGRAVRSGPIFVSRAGQFGRFAGEAYIETVMQEAGIKVIRPEHLPLARQLALYRGAETLIFSDGSALHGLQLLGRGLGRVAVLRRTAGRDLARASLAPRSGDLGYHDILRGEIVMLGPDGGLWRNLGLFPIAPQRFLEVMRDLGLPLGRHWDRAAFRAAEAADAETWLKAARALPDWRRPRNRRRVAAGLRQHFGLDISID